MYHFSWMHSQKERKREWQSKKIKQKALSGFYEFKTTSPPKVGRMLMASDMLRCHSKRSFSFGLPFHPCTWGMISEDGKRDSYLGRDHIRENIDRERLTYVRQSGMRGCPAKLRLSVERLTYLSHDDWNRPMRVIQWKWSWWKRPNPCTGSCLGIFEL